MLDRIIKLGENPDNVFMVGCPRIDLVAEILQNDPGALNIEPDLFLGGVGEKLDLSKDFVLVSQHPVTTEYGEGENQIFSTLNAINNLNIQAIVLWPNSDAGSEDIAKGIRKWREKNIGKKMHFFKNLPIDTYVRLMKRTKCLVGNSSSGIREGAFIGTPCVNIGTRQNRRERGVNVIDVKNIEIEIEKAISIQIEHGSYPMDPIYGTGNAGLQISEILTNLNNVNIQKIITY
jgi:UDP-hydrolysing UDP-N-acetyl-D-glucosamine 2-epimerase